MTEETVQVQCYDCQQKYAIPASSPELPDGPFICPKCLGDDLGSLFPPATLESENPPAPLSPSDPPPTT
jgi:hypothetical protein